MYRDQWKSSEVSFSDEVWLMLTERRPLLLLVPSQHVRALLLHLLLSVSVHPFFYPQLALPLSLCLCFLGLCVSVTVNTLATWHRSTFLLDRTHRERHLGVCVCVHVRGREYSPVTFCPSEWTHTHTRTHGHTLPEAASLPEIKHRFNLWHGVQTGLFAGENSLLGRVCVLVCVCTCVCVALTIGLTYMWRTIARGLCVSFLLLLVYSFRFFLLTFPHILHFHNRVPIESTTL